MSNIHNLEHEKSPVDFLAALQAAREHAPPFEADDPLGNGEIASGYVDKPDDYVIGSMHIPKENQVFTTDDSQYFALLRQAAEFAKGANLTDQDRDWLDRVAVHEICHGKTARDLGNSQTVSFYGVQLTYDGEGMVDFWPYHFTAGPLKKIHHAWVAVAPQDRSEIDMDIARDLGYDVNSPEGLEDLRRRATSEPPVEEGWQRTVSVDDIINALRRSRH